MPENFRLHYPYPINMNILAIDYGAKRIGLAWVDTKLSVVLPFGVVNNDPAFAKALAGKQGSGIKEQLGDIIKREKIDHVVVGLPLGLDGKENENTKSVRTFCDTLKSQVSVPIEFVDERFSSAEADRMEGNVSRDEKAAMVLLQAYLDKKAE